MAGKLGIEEVKTLTSIAEIRSSAATIPLSLSHQAGPLWRGERLLLARPAQG